MNNILRSSGFSRWAINEGPNSAGHIGPNVVEDNATSGTIPDPITWEPTLYDYLEPSEFIVPAHATANDANVCSVAFVELLVTNVGIADSVVTTVSVTDTDL